MYRRTSCKYPRECCTAPFFLIEKPAARVSLHMLSVTCRAGHDACCARASASMCRAGESVASAPSCTMSTYLCWTTAGFSTGVPIVGVPVADAPRLSGLVTSTPALAAVPALLSTAARLFSNGEAGGICGALSPVSAPPSAVAGDGCSAAGAAPLAVVCTPFCSADPA